ncbi:hypothetical protein JCM15519_01520 [Fundidesulfovibrio butyratiphilus]
MERPTSIEGGAVAETEAKRGASTLQVDTALVKNKLSTPLDFALHLAQELGCAVFPIRPECKSPPFVAWRLQSTSDLGTITAWARQHPNCNWGVDLGKSGLVALDVDNKTPERLGDQGLARLEFELGLDLAGAIEVRTPTNGGKHYVFKGNCGSRYAAIDDEKLSVEVRSDGSYIVAAGSQVRGADGVLRKYEMLTPPVLRPAPQLLLDLGGAPKAERVRHANRPAGEALAGAVPDADCAVLQALEVIAGAPEAGQGGRNASAYKMACSLRDRGVSEDAAFTVLAKAWNPVKCQPPLDEIELRDVTSHAFTYARGAAGEKFVPTFEGAPVDWSHPLLRGEPEPDAGPSSGRAPLDLSAMQAGAWLDQPVQPPDFVLQDSFIAGDTAILGGPSGVSKSTLSMQIALAVAGAHDALLAGLFKLGSNDPGRVFALFGEDRMSIVQTRFNAMLDAYLPLDFSEDAEASQTVRETIKQNLFARSMVGESMRLAEMKGGVLRPSAFYKELRRLLVSSGGWRLIILDCLSRIYAGQENDNGTATFNMELLEGLAQSTGAAVLLLHHAAKPSGQLRGKGLAAVEERLEAHRLRGASAITAAARSQFGMVGLRPDEARLIGGAKDAPHAYLALNSSKSNYAALTGLRFARRGHGGVLFPFHPPKKADQPGLEALPGRVIEEVSRLAEAGEEPCTPRAFSRRLAAVWRGDFPRLSENRLRECVEVLVHEGRLRLAFHQGKNRRTCEVLEVVPPQAPAGAE